MTFKKELSRLDYAMENFSRPVHTGKWQGVDISNKPEMAMHELQHVFLNVPLMGESHEEYAKEIKPNLPWADNHFLERVCGRPINPGVEWKNWPYGHSAEKFLDENGKFNHNYMERYWPRTAGVVDYATQYGSEYDKHLSDMGFSDPEEIRGIYHRYGDLRDVVTQLAKDPLTRQAMLPVFFPEDTGAVHGGRIPCSIAYQFFMRDNRLDVVYWLRSCDMRRHLRDDIYLTVRLLLWILEEVRKLNSDWNTVTPGKYVMMITSLHIFRNDYLEMFPQERP